MTWDGSSPQMWWSILAEVWLRLEGIQHDATRSIRGRRRVDRNTCPRKKELEALVEEAEKQKVPKVEPRSGGKRLAEVQLTTVPTSERKHQRDKERIICTGDSC